MKILLGFLVSLLVACHDEVSNKVSVTVDDTHHLICKVAQTPDQLSQGLMFKTSMQQDEGMLFVFNYNYAWPFWMKNTLIPLDIIWLDAKKHIVYIEKNVPPCPKVAKQCPSYAPNEKTQSKYVLEINAGRSDALGLRLNQKLDF